MAVECVDTGLVEVVKKNKGFELKSKEIAEDKSKVKGYDLMSVRVKHAYSIERMLNESKEYFENSNSLSEEQMQHFMTQYNEFMKGNQIHISGVDFVRPPEPGSIKLLYY